MVLLPQYHILFYYIFHPMKRLFDKYPPDNNGYLSSETLFKLDTGKKPAK